MPTKAKAKSSQLIRGFEPYQETKGEEYMSEPMRAHFTGILNKWKLELMQEVDRTVHHMQDEAANFPDQLDRAAQEEEFSLELRTRDRERKLLKKIDEALKQIDADEYGYCEQCGVEIGIRRLEARPTASLGGITVTGGRLDVYAALQIDPGGGSGVTVSIGDVSLSEGDAGTTAFNFTVTLSAAAPLGGVTVDFATANGTALAGSDYVATNGTLIFAPGQTNKTIVVAVFGDTMVESAESFFVNLSSPTNATPARAQGIGTILSDDLPSAVYLRSIVGLPWGSTANEAAMSRVFGTNNWQDLRYETVNVSQVPQRSPFRYPGGKTWLIPTLRRWLSSLEPTCRKTFLEPFAGGASATLLAVMESFSEKAFFAELDGDVARVWNTVLSVNGCELAERVEGFKISKAATTRLFAHAANGAELSEKALAVLVITSSGR